MDCSDDFTESLLWFDGTLKRRQMLLTLRATMSGIHEAVAKRDLVEVRRCIEETGESVNKREIHYGLTPLHFAVLCNNLEMLDFLLMRENVEVNARCFKGETPLYLATTLDRIEFVEKLIQAGSDINISDNNNDTALHMSVSYPDICSLLLQHGARIHNNDSRGRTLHEAVANNCLELLYMLLYYNVDANVPGEDGHTPFMVALSYDNEEAQTILVEYVDDFNRIVNHGVWACSILSLALASYSPLVKDVMERGADLVYDDEGLMRVEDYAFSNASGEDTSVFKMVWERVRYSDSEKNVIDLSSLFRLLDSHDVPTYLQIVIESDNFEPVVEYYFKEGDYFLFIDDHFAREEFDLDQLTALTCRMLEYGFRLTSYDIHSIFFHYGYCELFRMLLYMDNDVRGWLPHMAVVRLIFDIDYDLESLVDEVDDIPKKTILQLLKYSICPRLIDALTFQYKDDERFSAILSSLPRVPSLIELARNAARKHIWQSFNITNTCQFYTTIDHLDIPNFYKNILTFKTKIYRVK